MAYKITAASVVADPTRGLMSASFQGLLWTQFLGTVNDNALRWLVIGIGKQFTGERYCGLTLNPGMVLTAGTICFVLPYLFLAAPAGYLADRFSKRAVIVYCKVAEILLMILTIAAIWFGDVGCLMLTVALMGCQSALFSPAKLGCIPEILSANRISAANGLFSLASVVATVVGMVIGNLLNDITQPSGTSNLWLSASVLVGLAILGWLVSLSIEKLPNGRRTLRFPWNAGSQTIGDIRYLVSHRPLFRVALGTMFFWSLGALAQINIDQFAVEAGTTSQSQMTPFLISLILGVGIGSVLAGFWSAGRIELGILPLGASGIIVGSLLLFTVRGSVIEADASWTINFIWACAFLLLLGFGAGMFSVPLSAYMQYRSPPETRGKILAASNFLTFAGILFSAVVFWLLRMPLSGEPFCSGRHIFLLCGIITIPVLVYIVFLIPQASIRFFVWLASKTIYRIRVYGSENIPSEGGALIVPNHVSWLDGILLLLVSARPIRMVVYAGNFRHGIIQWLGKLWDVILLPTRPKQLARVLRQSSQALLDGQLVCIFPEGGITRTGLMQPFKRGALKIHQGTGVPIIPVYLDELWGSIFSFQGGKFFWKCPQQWPYPISIHIGKPIEGSVDVHQIRQAVQQLGAEAVEKRVGRTELLPSSLIRICKKRKFISKVADSSGIDMTGGQLLTRILVLRRLLLREVLSEEERYVGLLLPPSAIAVATNAAVSMMNRISVNLNYSVSTDVMNFCIEECGIQHVLTSRRFVEKLSSMGVDVSKLSAELIYLEDLRDQPTLIDKIAGAWSAYFTPGSILQRQLGLHRLNSSDVLTVIFTSGSTGQPKGVMLTHGNILSNIRAIENVIHFAAQDVLMGILPFFHSFGYTVTMWGTLSINIKGVFHFNPLDAKQIGKLCRTYGGTVLLGTPTFLRSYLRRCKKEDFATLSVVVAGAEKLPAELCHAFEEKFGVSPVEGYGATELSPLVAVNIPPSRSMGTSSMDLKEGTVGRPIPGVSAKIIDLDTGETLSAEQSGMLWIKGPNVMRGYINRPDITNEVIRDGWYVTGDVAMIDSDGFIKITGRESRFSKIGGEMVPHIQIEETLTNILEADDNGILKAAVTAVPDKKKGERLVIIHVKLDKTPDEICKNLADIGLPNIYIPSRDSFVEVDELPVLGSGKLDLRQMKQIALKHFENDTE